jgi:hypothetical protein
MLLGGWLLWGFGGVGGNNFVGFLQQISQLAQLFIGEGGVWLG